VALLIAIMASRAQALGGIDDVEALAGGIRTAFLVGASISLLAVVTTFFIKKPDPAPQGGWGGGH
jgi:DHA2 family lincomycin resistance protein-like MFS transporter